MLNLKLIRIRHADTGNGLRVRAGPPRLADLIPGVVGVLHLGTDKVVPGVRPGAVGGRIDAGRHGAAHQFAARHQLDLGWIPYLGPRRRRKSVAVLPGVHIERTLVDRAGGRYFPRLAVHAGRRCHWKVVLLRIRGSHGHANDSTCSGYCNEIPHHRFLSDFLGCRARETRASGAAEHGGPPDAANPTIVAGASGRSKTLTVAWIEPPGYKAALRIHRLE